MKPVILITASITDDEKFLRVSKAYTGAVEKAGGIPLIPDCAAKSDIPRLLDIADGVLLSGGGDIDPRFFGETPIPELGGVSLERDEFEIELAKLATDGDMPTLAICRGVQVLNVALGGKVYQDIYSGTKKPIIKHSQQMPRHCSSHYVNIESGTVLERAAGAKGIWVNSFHHQAVSDLGKGLRIAAYAQDGITEAVELEKARFCLGVQWHPEHMIGESEHFGIFLEFIKAAQDR